jgi:hypothetical protein
MLETIHLQLGDVYKQTSVEALEMQYIPTFYFVEFLGEAFGKHNHPYIYLEFNMHLGDMSEKIVKETQPLVDEYYKNKHEQTKQVVILRDKNVNSDVPTIRLRAVEPFFEQEEDLIIIGVKKYLSNSRINRFKFDVPFTEGEKKSDQLNDLWLNRTLIESQEYFPWCLSRVPVLSKIHEQKFNPPQKSILDIKIRIEQMKEAMGTLNENSDLKKIQKLQSLMTGALTPRMDIFDIISLLFCVELMFYSHHVYMHVLC